MTTEREAFKAWLDAKHSNNKTLDDVLTLDRKAIAKLAWLDAWQASRKVALEDAAMVCEALSPVCYDTAGYTDCVIAIKDLK